MGTGYSDIDNVINQSNTLLEQQESKQNEIIDLGLQKTQNEVNKQKQNLDEEATKTAKGLYTDYKKASNPYGVNAEKLASQGLANSGYAESSQVNLYNNYQKNVTEVINNTTKLKAEADFNMNQAYIDADIQKAQNTIENYKQRAQLILQEYELKFARDQWEWQKQYQMQRDAVADDQWNKNYQMQLESHNASMQKKNSSGSNSSGIVLLPKTTDTTTEKTTTKKYKIKDLLDYNQRVDAEK